MWEFNGATGFVKSGVIVAPFFDYLHADGRLYHGFGVELVTPYKEDLKNNLYYATYHPEENAIKLCVPRVSYMHRFCRESLAIMAKVNGSRQGSSYVYIPSFEVQKNTLLNAIDKSKDQQTAKILIKGPPQYQIINGVLGKSNAEGETVKLNVDVCTVIKDTYDKEDRKTHTDESEGAWIANLRWYVVFEEVEAREWKTIPPPTTTEGESALDFALGGVATLSLGGST